MNQQDQSTLRYAESLKAKMERMIQDHAKEPHNSTLKAFTVKNGVLIPADTQKLSGDTEIGQSDKLK